MVNKELSFNVINQKAMTRIFFAFDKKTFEEPLAWMLVVIFLDAHYSTIFTSPSLSIPIIWLSVYPVIYQAVISSFIQSNNSPLFDNQVRNEEYDKPEVVRKGAMIAILLKTLSKSTNLMDLGSNNQTFCSFSIHSQMVNKKYTDILTWDKLFYCLHPKESPIQ